MAKHALKLPDDLKELLALCRAGNLFSVVEWIEAGKAYHPGPGRYTTTPFRAAVATGFHSLVEVFLREGIPNEEKERAFEAALNDGRLDLIQLLAKYGTDWRAANEESVLCCRNPHIVRWFIDQGFDLSGWRIAYALIARHREFLGIYMSARDRVPSAREQANIALRYHAREGNLKWVCLLLWAGADPRAEAPALNGLTVDQDDTRTALEEAVVHGRLEVVKKFGVDPRRDKPTELLAECWMCREPGIVKLLLDSGADPNGGSGETNPMHSLMRNFEWAIDPTFQFRSGDAALKCLELAASWGGRWRPEQGYDMGGLRRSLLRLSSYEAARYLNRLVDVGVFEGDGFRKFVATPKMKDLIARSQDRRLQSLVSSNGQNSFRQKGPRRRAGV